jgi:hypothetical protein
MKDFKDSRDDFWERSSTEPNAVYCLCCHHTCRINVNGNAEIHDGDWRELASVDDEYNPKDVKAAVEALWRVPTKEQLWHRIAKLAGRYTFTQSPLLGSRFFCVKWSAEMDVLRLIAHLRIEGREKRANRLQAALATWKAAK